jgi:hypothetical protein
MMDEKAKAALKCSHEHPTQNKKRELLLIVSASSPTTMTITIVVANEMERKSRKMDENAKVAPISINTPRTAKNEK